MKELRQTQLILSLSNFLLNVILLCFFIVDLFMLIFKNVTPSKISIVISLIMICVILLKYSIEYYREMRKIYKCK